MLADPQSVTINSVANSLPRVSTFEGKGIYAKDDGTVKMTVNQQPGKDRSRLTVRLDLKKVTADPFIPATNREVGVSVFFNIDRPNVGFTAAELKDFSQSLTTWLTASSGANLVKILGGES